MDNKDSSEKKNTNNVAPSLTDSTTISSDYLSERISRFGDKVNLFIDDLRKTGETIFSVDKQATKIAKDHDKIVESLLDGHIDQDIPLDWESQILDLQNEIKEIKAENSKLQQEIVDLQLQLHTISEHSDSIETLTVETIANEENLHEIKEVGILNYYNPEHWNRLLQLNNTNNLTLPILELLHTEQEIQLIIIALMLEADPAACLEVVKTLQNIGVVDLGFKTQGGLNPLVTLIKHF